MVNLSLSSRSEAMFGSFHDLADRAYFANTLLVCAANNVPGPSYPSLFAAVVSVAAHDVADPEVWFYNPTPPVEFGAYGVDVDVAWRDGGRIRATGNSFAAPHIAGLAARLRSAHPAATPFEIKAMLAATADAPGLTRAGLREHRPAGDRAVSSDGARFGEDLRRDTGATLRRTRSSDQSIVADHFTTVAREIGSA